LLQQRRAPEIKDLLHLSDAREERQDSIVSRHAALYDVAVLPGVRRPMAASFAGSEINEPMTFEM